MKLERFGCAMQQVKFIGGEQTRVGTFSGYGAVFGNVDSYGDVIAKGAFKRTLARSKMPKMLLQHGGMFFGGVEDGIPIGKWTSMEEDDFGLAVTGELFALETQKGQYIYEGLKSGALDGLSIGYVPVSFTQGQQAGEPERTLTDIELYECSIVTFPANTKALVDSVKSIEELIKPSDFEKYLRDAGASRSQAAAFVSGLRKSLRQSDSERQSQTIAKANESLRSLVSNITQR